MPEKSANTGRKEHQNSSSDAKKSEDKWKKKKSLSGKNTQKEDVGGYREERIEELEYICRRKRREDR